MKRIVAGVAGILFLTAPAWAADGAAVYAKKCKMCHSIAGVAGPMAKLGGPLDGVGSKRDAAWLTELLKNPKAKNPKAKMPTPKISDDERAAVVKYLLTLKK